MNNCRKKANAAFVANVIWDNESLRLKTMECENLYMANSWEKLQKILSTQIVDVVVVDVGFSPLIKEIKAFCTIPVIHICCENCLEDSFSDYRVAAATPTVRDDIGGIISNIMKDDTYEIELAGSVRCGDLKLDMDDFTGTFQDKPVSLKPMEMKLLFYLMKMRNRVTSKECLIQRIWGYDNMENSRTIDVHIKNIRKKLEEHCMPLQIITLRSVGYRLADKQTS